MSSDVFIQIFFNGLMLGLMLSMIAVGLTLVFGIMHIVNLAHGEIYMLGGFGIWILFAKLNINFIVSLVITAALVGFFGALIERFLFKPFRGNLLPSMIVSIGIILILQTSALLIFGIMDKPVPTPGNLEGTMDIYGAILSVERLIIIIIAAISVVSLFLFIRFTKPGKSMRAVADDQVAAALQGVDIDRTCSICMFIGCGLAGVAGSLMGCLFYVNSQMGATPFMKALVVLVLGGMGSIIGTILGAFIIGFVESTASTFISGPVAHLLIFLVLVIVLLVRPRGLFGHEE